MTEPTVSEPRTEALTEEQVARNLVDEFPAIPSEIRGRLASEIAGALVWMIRARAEAAQPIDPSPTVSEPRTEADVPCVHPGCGLPDRLHGAPDLSRPTHSSHWYRRG